MLIYSCTNKTNCENQITIKINSIDVKTKQLRVNMFDTVDVRITKSGFCSLISLKASRPCLAEIVS